MNLLALVESPDHVCCRYRIRAFAPALQEAGWSLTCEGLDQRRLAPDLCSSTAPSGSTPWSSSASCLPAWQLRILRRRRSHLVFDFDDAVLYRDSNDPRGRESRRRRRRFAAVMGLADTVVAGNDFLADCALRAGARVEDVHVIPTCVDPRRYPIARTSPPRARSTWSGSASRARCSGLEQPAAIWGALAAAVPGLRLRVICDRFPGLSRSRSSPCLVRADEARQLAAGQIGVSWLPDDLWSRGKCGLKVFQYQAAGLPVVANPVGCQSRDDPHRRERHPGDDPRRMGRGRPATRGRPRAAATDGDRRPAIASRRIIRSSAWSETFVHSMTGGSRQTAALGGLEG